MRASCLAPLFFPSPRIFPTSLPFPIASSHPNSTLFTPGFSSLPRFHNKMSDHHEDLAATKTEGFKVGEKKTMEEYQELGKEAFPFSLE